MTAVAVLPPYRAGVAADPEWMTGFALAAEELGFESIYTVEHVAVPVGYAEAYPYSATGRMPLADDCPIPDPLDLLAFLAARTERIGLGTGVLVGPHHHPLVLAKRLSTVDNLSGGRLHVGIGVGWMAEEVESTGAAFRTRGRRVDELLAALRAIWDVGEDGAGRAFEGEFFSFGRLHSSPHPAQPGGVPLHVGGHSEAAARRAGRWGDGLHPLGLDDDGVRARWALARRTAEEHGRDPDALTLTLTLSGRDLDAAALAHAEDLGAGRVVVSTAGDGDLAEVVDVLAGVAERLELQNGRAGAAR